MTHKEKQKAIEAINDILENNESEYRLCCVCGKPLREGYYYSSSEMCCSDKCGAKFEKVPLADFVKERNDVSDADLENWEEGYWTTVPV